MAELPEIEPIVEPEMTAAPQGKRGALRALRHRNYKLFFYGQMISLFGTWMQATALPLLIVQLQPDHAGLWLGIANFVPLIPTLPLAVMAGSWADRFSKHKIMLLTQTTLMLQALILAILTFTQTIQIWHVLVLTLVLGAASAVDIPARQAFVVDMVDDRADLDSAIALNSAIFNLGRAIGPVLAGLLIAPLGFSAAFLINSLSFLAVIAGLLMMRLPPKSVQIKPPKLSVHMIEGFQYALRNQSVRILMTLIAVSAFLSMPFMTLMPIFVKPARVLRDGTVIEAAGVLAASAQPINDTICRHITCQTPDAVPFGLLMGAFGIGALVGALLVGSLSGHRRGTLLTLGNLGFPIAVLLFAISQSFWLSMTILFVVGIVFVMQNALANTLLQVIVPDQLRGRLMSIYSIVLQGMQKAGGMQAGFTQALAGAPFSVAIGAIISAVYGCIVFWRWPQIRRLK